MHGRAARPAETSNLAFMANRSVWSGEEEVHCRYIHADASKALQGRYDLPHTHVLQIRGWVK
jgi:hypothetical protein